MVHLKVNTPDSPPQIVFQNPLVEILDRYRYMVSTQTGGPLPTFSFPFIAWVKQRRLNLPDVSLITW
ncbi:MAG: hypothetical protein ACE5KJ_05985 [Candidatus Zixiibacteriota bacterium]